MTETTIETTATKGDEHEVLFTIEGVRKPLSLAVALATTVGQFLELVRQTHGRIDLIEILIEDEDAPLGVDEIIVARLTRDDFRLIHVATAGEIEVTVVFNGHPKHHKFRPNATMERIVKWALKAFELEGDPSDFQLKHGDEILPAGEHLGQVAHGKKEVKLSLVMKIKPQG